MDIVIIGDGKVGHKLAMQLSGEKYNVTLIDKSEPARIFSARRTCPVQIWLSPARPQTR